MDHVTKSHPLIPNVSPAPDEDTVEVKSNTNAASQTSSNQLTTNNEINAMPNCEISQNLILVDKICLNKTTQLELTNNHDNNNVSFKINTSTYDERLSHFQENQFSKAEQVMTELYADPIIPRSLVQKVSLKFQEFYHQSIDDLKKYLEGLFTDDEKLKKVDQSAISKISPKVLPEEVSAQYMISRTITPLPQEPNLRLNVASTQTQQIIDSTT
ncbi:hypothetical protein HCN44_004784 [Aphidius gifuensis]|uniref:Uncharacterized protein n=1 Tax=Aphidius gifuensis TaxID=684658 RepID=A0A834XKL4_APHGI|nr:hypothetical protein HCN44_004784 [Aphidius gifuensis]